MPSSAPLTPSPMPTPTPLPLLLLVRPQLGLLLLSAWWRCSVPVMLYVLP